MANFAYLPPVGPFAGLSTAAKERIGRDFPALHIVEIESAAESFSAELRALRIEPRLAETRDELNVFLMELSRLEGALKQVREHRLDQAIGEAGRIISGSNSFEDLARSANNVRAAIRQTSRALPGGSAQLASRRLVAALALLLDKAGHPVSGPARNSLCRLVDLIFEDLMIGGDAASAVRDWKQSQAARIDCERATTLLNLVS